MEASTSAVTPSPILANLSVTEKLLVAQAVYASGNADFRNVSKLLQGHPLLKDRQRGDYTPEQCHKVFDALMEDMELDPKPTLAAQSPILLKLARKWYLGRVIELREAMQKEEDQFRITFSEIQNIQEGKMDEEFLKEMEAKEKKEKQEAALKAMNKQIPRPGPITVPKHRRRGARNSVVKTEEEDAVMKDA